MKLLVNGKQFNVNIIESSQKGVLFEINNKNYYVEVDNNLSSKSIDPLKKTNSNQIIISNKDINIISAEIPGLISSIKVNIGDKVMSGDTALTLEAMKMQNRVIIPKDCTIKNILVEQGQEVSKGQLLIELE